MKAYHLLPLLFFANFSITCAAQEIYSFKNGLIVTMEVTYGREAIYKDALAWRLYSHRLEIPTEGGNFGVSAGGQPVVWKAVTADSLNRFRVRGFGQGFGGGGGTYLYLTYTAEKQRAALLHITGDGGLFFNGVPHAGDPYGSGWLYIPVILKKGLNELYVRVGGPVVASLVFPKNEIQLNTEDPTVPVIVAGAAENDSLRGAVVVINASGKALKNYSIEAVSGGKRYTTAIPEVQPMSSRKVAFAFCGAGVQGKGHFDCAVRLVGRGGVIDEKTLAIEAVGPGESYSVTFESGIDGSLQYYAVTPQVVAEQSGVVTGQKGVGYGTRVAGPALFLSVHGAGVEAIGQARAYKPKDWGTLVAATNRRPRGFNWEDWGRQDAMEVLELGKARFKPDPQLIYLTGHSMGGHGTWFLGATYPDKWAAIGACSGYPTLKDYGSHDGVVPDSSGSPVEQLLLRASDQSDVIQLATNYKPLGVYILHGDSDKVVPVKYARQMRSVLAAFHTDMSYHEVPGAEHWYGNQSVDWGPLFDFFQWHVRKPDSLVNQIDFKTASPGISDSYYWASIQQQVHPLEYSRVQLMRDLRKGTITGITDNVRLLKFALGDFGGAARIRIELDGLTPVEYTMAGAADSLYLLKNGSGWTVTTPPGAKEKRPQRYGTLKDAFRNRMVFVYGTTGNEEENRWGLEKARYDAETWYYRGNGAVDIVADRAFSAAAYPGRSVILFGNASTNAAYKGLLGDCPILLERGKITAGERVFTGDSLAAYFVWPLRNSSIGCVAVIGGTGVKGMEAANANQYFAGASGFPDYMIFGLEMLQGKGAGVLLDGYFDNDWKIFAGDEASSLDK